MYHRDTSILYFCMECICISFVQQNTFTMEPINFKESNMTLTAPGAMPDCGDLPVYTDGRQCVSCWKMSVKERLKILFTGRMWLGVIGSRTQPPVWLSSGRPFYRTTVFDEISAFFFNVADFFRDCGRTIREVTKRVQNEPDKKKHFYVGSMIAFIIALAAGIMYGIRSDIIPGMSIGFAAGVVAGSVAGFLKEVYDKKSKKGTPERMDWYATIFGSVFGSCIASVIIAVVLLFI